MSGATWLLCGLVFATHLILRSDGAKILLIPNPAYSVCREMVSIGDQLALGGHDVVVYQLEGFQGICPGKTNMKVITYASHDVNHRDSAARWQMIMQRALSSPYWYKGWYSIYRLALGQELICKTSLSDTVALQKLKDENFDFVLIDGSTTNACYAVIPYILNVTFAIESAHMLSWPNVRPFLPHMMPDVFSHFTCEMTISETFANAMMMMYKYFLVMYHIPMNYVNAVAPELTRKQTMDLLVSAKLYLENEDSLLGYANPQSPNIVPIGGILTKPGKTLPTDIDTFLNKSKDGAIVVAFGSFFYAIPKEIDDKFSEAFSQLNVSVIWKHGVNETKGNMMKKTWLPLNDIFAHNNIKLIIYHCGINGVFEALYHGVPVICCPVMYDQPQIAARMTKVGVAKTIDLNTFSATELRDTINDMLYNTSYNTKMRKLSQIFHSRPQSPRQRAAYWIDHVIKYGSDHLQSTSSQLPAYRHMMLDVMFIGIGGMLLVFFGFLLCIWKVCAFCKQSKYKVKTQ